MEYYRPQSFTFLPLVVKNLLIINALCFLADISLETAFGIQIKEYLGLHYPAAEKFSPYQFITYIFMHGNFSHLLFNMFAFWMFGYALENYWGPKKFLIYFFVTGIGAALIHYLVVYFEIKPVLSVIDNFLQKPTLQNLNLIQGYESVKSETYMHEIIASLKRQRMEFLNDFLVVGASGSVFGILLAFGMMFPNTLIYLYFAIPVKAKYLVIGYGVLELYAGISKQGDNVAHFAHLGGMIFGFFLIKFWDKSKNNIRWLK